MSSWWGKPEYNGIKALVLVVVVVGAGYFVYNSMQQNALENTGQVGSKTPGGSGSGSTGSATGVGTGGNPAAGTASGTASGTSKGTTAGGTTGRDPICLKGSTMTLTAAADNATFTGGPLYFDNNYQEGGHFIVTNPTDCPVTVKTIMFSVAAPAFPTTDFTPIGGVTDPGTSTNGTLKLHLGYATTPITITNPATGATHVIHRPTGALFGLPVISPTIVSGPLVRTLTFTSSTGVLIPPTSSQQFDLEVSTWNNPPKGGGSATSSLIPGGITFSMRQIIATNIVGAIPNPYNWTFATSGLALPAVTSSSVYITYP